MSPLLAVLLAAAGQAAEPAPSDSAMPLGVTAVQSPDASPRTGQELRQAIREALRQWAKPTDEQAESAAREFISLFIELERDDQLASSQREYLRTRVRTRLLELRDQIARRVAIDRRLARQTARERGQNSAQKSDSMADHPNDDSGLLQDPPARGGAGIGAADYGPALVDLIQRTVRPETWDVNGGTGTIYYWYPGRALVIRQMGEVHDRVGGVLDQLRRVQN